MAQTLDCRPEEASFAPPGSYIKALAYVGPEVSDLDAWERFGGEVLGLEVRATGRPDRRILRIDDRPYRFLLVEGPADDIGFAGWEVESAQELRAYADYLRRQAVDFEWATVAEADERGVDGLLRLRDPNGVIHEISTGVATAERFSSSVTRGGFVTGANGLGHIVFGASDYDRSIAFAGQVLGAGLSDVIEQVITPSVSAHATFLHVNERHHSIAFARNRGRKKLHHFMIEVEKIEDVGLARDRHLRSGFAIAQDIGQHPNDRMISYYGVTPSGFFVEYGWGGVRVDVGNWQPRAYDRMSDWGHRPVIGAGAAAPSPASVPEPPVAQNWNLVISTPMGEQSAELTLNAALKGRLVFLDDAVEVHDAALSGARLSFKADVSRPFQMTLAFTLTIAGNTCAGDVQAGALGASPVKGRRR